MRHGWGLTQCVFSINWKYVCKYQLKNLIDFVNIYSIKGFYCVYYYMYSWIHLVKHSDNQKDWLITIKCTYTPMWHTELTDVCLGQVYTDKYNQLQHPIIVIFFIIKLKPVVPPSQSSLYFSGKIDIPSFNMCVLVPFSHILEEPVQQLDDTLQVSFMSSLNLGNCSCYILQKSIIHS